jgi:N-acetyl-gamma-glutamyl-phosphate reductase
VASVSAATVPAINFIPMRGDFTRGIFASVYTTCDLSQEKIEGLYQDYYKDTPFTSVYPNTIHLKQVVNTNHCLLQIQTHEGKVHITSILDNLLKGAAGHAVQNMNIVFGMDETLGLNLKANYF